MSYTPKNIHELLTLPGLLNDRAIRELVARTGMIAPFHETTKIPDTISFGLTSFGYDARLAPEYRVFNSQPKADEIIDPKHFDSAICERHSGDTCIIPPHGFLLGHTIEYFKIPKDISVICLGRSTYARCFTAQTTVLLHDGSTDTFENLYKRQNLGEVLTGVSINPTTKEKVNNPLTQIRPMGMDTVVEVTFSDGSVAYPTADHEFLTYDTDGSITLTPAVDLNAQTPLVQFTYNTSETLSVVTVIAQATEQTVYCLTEAEFGNFALGNGAIVSNCACIVNVTPLEPEWEGQVTLELSNTANRPLRVYGNEGVCQFLFFRGIDAAEISYKDKDGKYMGQRGVTYARVEAG